MGTGKPKINTTTRIRINHPLHGLMTVYVSTEALRRLRINLIKLESLFVPRKGKADEVCRELYAIANEIPDHMMAGGRTAILNGATPRGWMHLDDSISGFGYGSRKL